MEKRSIKRSPSTNHKPSVLTLLQRSIESLHSLRRGRSGAVCRLSNNANSPFSTCINASREDLRTSENSNKFSSVAKRNPKELEFYHQTRSSASNFPSRNSSPSALKNPNQERINKLIRNFSSKRLTRKIDFSEEITTENSKPRERPEDRMNRELLGKAQSELMILGENKVFLERKIKEMNENLCEVSSIHIEEQSALLSIINKLDKLEDIAIKESNERRAVKIPNVIEKISSLEFNYNNLKACEEGSLKNFREELGQVNHKIQDLKECNNILKELVFCLHKEPVYITKTMQNAETSMDFYPEGKSETIPMSKIMDSQAILQDLYEKRDQLVRDKEKMESEYKLIPQDSKSISNKRKKQALELELSMNYSKLMSITNKIKNYAA